MIPSVDITPWLEVKNYTEDSTGRRKSSISNHFCPVGKIKKNLKSVTKYEAQTTEFDKNFCLKKNC